MRAIRLCLILAVLSVACLAWAQPVPGEGPPPGGGPFRGNPPPGAMHSEEREHLPQAPREADWALYRLLEGRRELLPAALRAATDDDPLTRRRGLFTLGMLGLPQGLSAARANLKHPDRLVRMQAAVALTALYCEEGLPGAAAALREGPDWLRFYALHGLWRLNSSRSLNVLRATPVPEGFVLETKTEALKASPRLRVNTLRSGEPDPQLSLYGLWSRASGAFIIESDLWWHQGNYDQCIRAQWTALFFDPSYVDLYTNIAWLQWSMDRHDEAIRTYEQAILANPKSWAAYQALGDYYVMHGKKSVGATYLQQAADLGSPPLDRRRLGHVYRDIGEAEKAKQVWQDILKLDPNDPIAKRELERAAQAEGATTL